MKNPFRRRRRPPAPPADTSTVVLAADPNATAGAPFQVPHVELLSTRAQHDQRADIADYRLLIDQEIARQFEAGSRLSEVADHADRIVTAWVRQWDTDARAKAQGDLANLHTVLTAQVKQNHARNALKVAQLRDRLAELRADEARSLARWRAQNTYNTPPTDTTLPTARTAGTATEHTDTFADLPPTPYDAEHDADTNTDTAPGQTPLFPLPTARGA